eukprot:3191062-Pleurochrysis_carterae.AAC.2
MADFFTKPLPPRQLFPLRDQIMNDSCTVRVLFVAVSCLFYSFWIAHRAFTHACAYAHRRRVPSVERPGRLTCTTSHGRLTLRSSTEFYMDHI